MFMLSDLIVPLASHLWQSTLFSAAALLLTSVLRKNAAGTRYWLWLAASVKFLVPFSLNAGLSSRFEWRAAPVLAAQLSSAMEQIGQPFASKTGGTFAPEATFPVIPALLLVAWLSGCALVLTMWWRHFRRIRLEYNPDNGGDKGTADAEKVEASGGDSGPSIFAALQEQLRLKLEAAKGSVDTFVMETCRMAIGELMFLRLGRLNRELYMTNAQTRDTNAAVIFRLSPTL